MYGKMGKDVHGIYFYYRQPECTAGDDISRRQISEESQLILLSITAISFSLFIAPVIMRAQALIAGVIKGVGIELMQAMKCQRINV